MYEAPAKPRILIVEDDHDLAEMLKAYLAVQNYEVTSAGAGLEAVDVSQNETFNLVLLDIRLPDIDGYEVCRRIRTSRRTQDVPIIFLTEKRDRVDKLHGLELGVVDYITKPFDIQEVRLRVRNALNRVARLGMTNPVTDLPEAAMTEDRLNALALSDDDWAVLLIALSGMTSFRERYGFVAADDVLRAVTLMVRNAARDHGAGDDYLGHYGPEEFILVTTAARAALVRERTVNRVRQSTAYFLPVRDRERLANGDTVEMIHIKSSVVSKTDGPFSDAMDIRQKLLSAATVA